MKTERPESPKNGININQREAALVEAERKRLGITEEMLATSRKASLSRPF
jgi:hypothetical protein